MEDYTFDEVIDLIVERLRTMSGEGLAELAEQFEINLTYKGDNLFQTKEGEEEDGDG